ncbi:M15 family metallopeptidase [Helicobacter sp. 23-1048]
MSESTKKTKAQSKRQKMKRIVVICCAFACAICANPMHPNLFEAQSSNFIHDLRYGTIDNFMGVNLYKHFGLDKCFLHNDLGERVKRLSEIASKERVKIVFFDCFRPQSAQIKAWEKMSDERFVANPYKNGSNHSRAIALDVGLADENGEILAMPSEFDEFSQKAFSDYKCTKAEAQKCANREKLKAIMKEAGFRGIKSEWWHYEADFTRDSLPLDTSQIRETYPLLDLP